MKLIKEYICDDRTPSDDELLESINIANENNCIIKLKWFFPYNGWNRLYIQKDMTLDECKEKLPKVYGV